MTPRLTIYTAANRLYEPFILPYIASNLLHNPQAHVEIGVEDAPYTQDYYDKGLRYIAENISPHFSLNTVDFGKASPNNIRFLAQPKTRADYVYIGDIDILILEDIARWHITRMAETKRPYSNTLRPGKKALSGLHFSSWDAFYPLPDLSHIPNARTHPDEALLYEIVTGRGHTLPRPDDKQRPLHGFHLSLNRRPRRWGIDDKSQQDFRAARLAAYMALTDNELWAGLWPFFDPSYQRLFAVLDYAIEAYAPDLFIAAEKRYLTQLFFTP